MKSLLQNRWFWPAVASPLAAFGIVAMTGGRAPGVVSGLGLLLGWVLSFPFGRAEARSVADPTPRSQFVVAGWGALAVACALGGLWLGRALETGF
ncbi:hypothetical protein [Cellulomonas soli]